MPKNRLERIDPSEGTEEQKTAIASLIESRGRVPTPFNIWLHNPALSKGMEIIGNHLDATPVLSEAESEIAILSTAVFWNAPYVIANHRRAARKSGLPEDVIMAIIEKRQPTCTEKRWQTVCDAVSALLKGGAVDDAQFVRYEEELGRAAIAELLVTIGYFTSVSLAMTLHGLEPKP